MRRRFRSPLKHLNQSGNFPSGNPRYYAGRKGAKRTPMPDRPWDHPEFLEAYAKALDDKVELVRPASRGSLAAAIQQYRQSDAFKALSKGTRYARQPMLDAIAEKYGHGQLATLGERHIKAALSEFSGHARNNRLKAWRHFGQWLVDEKGLSSNPAANVKKSPTPKSDGHIPWSSDDVERFRDHWSIGTAQRLAFEVIYWTGARVSDAIRLGEKNLDGDGWLSFIQEKTGGAVSVPFDRALPEFADGFAPDLEMLKRALKARNERHITWLHTQAGASRSSKAASQWFATQARRAGLADRTAHGLRKSRAIAIAEAGGEAFQVQSWTGHDSLREVERYTKNFDRKKALMRTNEEQKVPTPSIKFQEKG